MRIGLDIEHGAGDSVANAQRKTTSGGFGRAYGVPFALSAALLIVLIRTAWISDDAYITFRTVANFADGYGLRWNVAERVQSFTHPLWMLLIALGHHISGEPYFATLFLSVFVTMLALVAVIALADSPVAATIGLALLLSSKAFIDYSTSGLEN